MLISSPDRSTCLFSWYGLLIMVGGVGLWLVSVVTSVRSIRSVTVIQGLNLGKEVPV